MTARISLSRKYALACVEALEASRANGSLGALGGFALDNIRDALRLRKAKPHATIKKARTLKKASKRAATRDIRALVAERAGDICECGCGRSFVGYGGNAQLDHFDGKARSESFEACWLIRADCHRSKGLSIPSAKHWLEKFRAHCIRRGFWSEGSLAGRRLASAEYMEQHAPYMARGAR